MLNENEIDRIANAINALRPDWPVKSLRTLIASKLAHRTRRDVAVALAWVAADGDSLKPARVLEAGPWWQGLGQETRVPRNPGPGDECKRHRGQYRTSCSSCASERLAPVVPIRPDVPAPSLAELRGRLRAETLAYQAKVRAVRDERNDMDGAS